MRTYELIIAVATGWLLCQSCERRPVCPTAPPRPQPPCASPCASPCVKCVYKRYHCCKD